MIFLASSCATIIFVLDRLTKIAAADNIAYGTSIKVLPGIFHLTFILNNGTAFGLMKGQNTLFAILSVVAMILILAYIRRNRDLGLTVSLALGLILGGAAGNLFDRIKFGHVIDFLDFRVWPVFNVADSAITIGVSILVIMLCTQHSLK
jgi:signal peptidase II